MKLAQYFSVFIFLISIPGQAGVEDIQSMVNNNGRFDVFCKSGEAESLSANDIRANQVCDDGSTLEEAYDACRIQFDGQTNERKCFSAVREYRMNADQINQCANEFDGDTNELACVEAAGPNNLYGPGINACGLAFDGDANELACVQWAINLTDSEINTCELGFDGDSNELMCVQISGERGLKQGDIQFCLDQAAGDAAELECLRTL